MIKDTDPLIINEQENANAWLDDFITRELSQVTQIFSGISSIFNKSPPQASGEITETKYVPSEEIRRGFKKMVARV